MSRACHAELTKQQRLYFLGKTAAAEATRFAHEGGAEAGTLIGPDVSPRTAEPELPDDTGAGTALWSMDGHEN